MTTAQIVHFTVDADFITGHARRLWSEAEYKKAFDFLSTLRGITKKEMGAVINGKKKFKEVGRTQTFILVSDNWKPDASRCHLGLYPNPESKLQMERAQDVLNEKRKGEMLNQICGRLLDKAGNDRSALTYIRNLVVKHDLDDDFTSFLQAAQEYLKGRDYRQEANEQFAELQKFLEGQEYNNEIEKLADSKKKPKPSADVTENGIITPDGKFFRCEFAGHNVLANALGYQSDPPLEPASVAVREGCMVLSANLVSRKCRIVRSRKTDVQHEKFRQWFALVFRQDIPYEEFDS